MSNQHRFGFVTLSGPPNAGKSTLLNRIMGQKLSITSRRPQTTRHRVLGIKTMPEAQIVFVDTPGLHHDQKKNLNRVINRTAIDSLIDVDLVLFMIDYHGWGQSNKDALRHVIGKGIPVILLINKIDRMKDVSQLLPLIQASSELHDFVSIIPISALKLKDQEAFLADVIQHLPEGPPGFPEDQITNRSIKFMASELVREQLFLTLGQELPYETAVEIVKFDDADEDHYQIDAIIWVEKSGQKRIVIGKQGSQLKAIGKQARLQMERMYETRVHLNLWVKQRKGWADNAKLLQTLGYDEE